MTFLTIIHLQAMDPVYHDEKPLIKIFDNDVIHPFRRVKKP